MSEKSLAPVEQEKLTEQERARLAELEAIIASGLQTAFQVWFALKEINEKRLYKETHARFEDYVRERFGIERAHAYRQIEAARVVEALSPFGDVPANEAQARELAPLMRKDEEQGIELFRSLRAEHGAGLTATQVKTAVQAFLSPRAHGERVTQSEPRRLIAALDIAGRKARKGRSRLPQMRLTGTERNRIAMAATAARREIEELEKAVEGDNGDKGDKGEDDVVEALKKPIAKHKKREEVTDGV
jgi:hypothetical protein